ncbi:MAG: acyloxyacyl hydrolase [Marinobacter sp.]|uniref:acyloxyacyl hydrolase n=1 Tax=Marinobacter sp. TaxID=50741 RepID=UPI00299DD1E6|nr:acyloxyacyl hydrolase [Marinobacter sp.]MDX1755079.1 acyloxyacyl hydrolase [Marinobacter sp.]
MLPLAVQAEANPALLNLNIGEEGLDRSLNNATRYGIEYRFRALDFHRLVPSVGYVWVDNGATFAYVEMRRDFELRGRWLLTPSFGFGAFHEEPGLQLGHTTEFRSGLELSYRLDNHYRLGLAIYHLSNGGLSDENPGTESLVASLSIPI